MSHNFLDIVSGEFFLRKRSNGGAVVFSRALLITIIAYLIAVVVRWLTANGVTAPPTLDGVICSISSTIPWAGAIFAGAYVALYTRYSNQWSYLANTYNQIKATKSSLSATELQGNEALVNWQAGFAVDAYILHLDRKDIFAGVIEHMLTDEDIKEAILKNFTGDDLMTFKQRHLPNNPSKRAGGKAPPAA